MLVIRNHQKSVLAADTYQRYQEHLVAMLHELYPAACGARGTDAVRGLVLRAAQRANELGLVIYGDIGKYVMLAFAMGEDFETNPNHGWAGATVRDPQFQNPSDMIRELYRRAGERLGQHSR